MYTYSTLTWSAWHHVTNTLVTLVSVSLSILTPHRHLTSLHKASRQQECGCHLESQQQQERLNAVEASVNKVAHKQIVCVRNVSADFEEFFEVIKLAMDVTTHLQHTHTHDQHDIMSLSHSLHSCTPTAHSDNQHDMTSLSHSCTPTGYSTPQHTQTISMTWHLGNKSIRRYHDIACTFCSLPTCEPRRYRGTN